MIGLIAGAGLLALALAAVAVARRQLLGPDAAVLSVIRPDDAGLTLVGLVQVAVCAGGVAVVIAALPRRRFRLLAGLAVAGAVAAEASWAGSRPKDAIIPVLALARHSSGPG